MSETLITTEEERTELPDADAPCTAELAECTCPELLRARPRQRIARSGRPAAGCTAIARSSADPRTASSVRTLGA